MIGIDRFGASAPAAKIAEHLGFTPTDDRRANQRLDGFRSGEEVNPPDPGAVLSMWAAGLAAAVALVASWKVARPGFILLGTAVAAAIGFLAALAGAGWWAAMAAAHFTLGDLSQDQPLGGDAAGRGSPALARCRSCCRGRWLIVISGAIALGGITSEMLLGHWYLVDPKLPRRSLKILAAIGAAGDRRRHCAGAGVRRGLLGHFAGRSHRPRSDHGDPDGRSLVLPAGPVLHRGNGSHRPVLPGNPDRTGRGGDRDGGYLRAARP